MVNSAYNIQNLPDTAFVSLIDNLLIEYALPLLRRVIIRNYYQVIKIILLFFNIHWLWGGQRKHGDTLFSLLRPRGLSTLRLQYTMLNSRWHHMYVLVKASNSGLRHFAVVLCKDCRCISGFQFPFRLLFVMPCLPNKIQQMNRQFTNAILSSQIVRINSIA